MQLMTESGRKALPETLDTGTFAIDPDIVHTFGKNPVAWENFRKFPELYRRIRIDTIQRDKSKDIALFWKGSSVLYRNPNRGKCSARGMITAGY